MSLISDDVTVTANQQERQPVAVGFGAGLMDIQCLGNYAHKGVTGIVAGESEQRVELLDTSAMGQMLREHRGALSLRQAAADAGVSFTTFARVESGAQPDLASYQLLCAWLGVSPARFFSVTQDRPERPIDAAVAHLRSDPNLSAENAERIADVLTSMYEALATPPDDDLVMAVHLRAAKMLRPGVPERLTALLLDIDKQLRRKVAAGEL